MRQRSMPRRTLQQQPLSNMMTLPKTAFAAAQSKHTAESEALRSLILSVYHSQVSIASHFSRDGSRVNRESTDTAVVTGSSVGAQHRGGGMLWKSTKLDNRSQ